MKHAVLALAAALSLTLTAAPVAADDAPAAPAAPRTVVRQIAEVIRQGYFDPARAEVIASTLTAEAEAGRYDALTDPRDLQEALTQRLKSYDRHFSVTAPAPTSTQGPSSVAPATSALQPVPFPVGVARRGQGFRAVEILPGNIGLIDMRMFIDFDGPEDAARRQADAVLQLVSNTDAVIFDLRDNGGGSPAMVGYLVSAFVAPGADIYSTFHSREGTESEAPKQPYAHPRPDVPVYVLISGRSGSAAEAFPYTLQAARRATIVGETSVGAANPGEPVSTPSGYRVFVSDGTPINPITKTNWEGVGVKPDIEAPADQALNVAWQAALAKQTERLTGPVAVEAAWVLEALRAPADLAFRAEDYLGGYGGSRVQTADGFLTLQSGRRPAWRLKPLSPDLFFDVDEPYRRVRFERDAAGRVTALETLDAQIGGGRRLSRNP